MATKNDQKKDVKLTVVKSEMVSITIEKAMELQSMAYKFSAKQSHWGWANHRIVERLKVALKEFYTRWEDKRSENALTIDNDKNKGFVLTEKGEYTYSPESKKGLDKWYRSALQESIEIEPYMAKSYSEIDEDVRLLEFYNGICVDVDIDDIIEKKFNK